MIKRKILKIYAKIKAHFYVDYKPTENEKDIYDTFLKFLYTKGIKMIYFPNSEKWMLITKDERYFLTIQNKFIKIANHKIYTEREINDKLSTKMIHILNIKVENERIKYEKMIETNFKNMISGMSKDINNEK